MNAPNLKNFVWLQMLMGDKHTSFICNQINVSPFLSLLWSHCDWLLQMLQGFGESETRASDLEDSPWELFSGIITLSSLVPRVRRKTFMYKGYIVSIFFFPHSSSKVKVRKRERGYIYIYILGIEKLSN